MKRSALPILVPALLATIAMTPPLTALAQSAGAGASHARSAGATGHGQLPGHTAADVRFMKGMIAHHAQAMAMTSLVAERTASRDIHLVAQRIRVSQRDEIALMQSWLRKHGEEVPSPDTVVHVHDAGDRSAMHEMPGMAGDHALMPGMLTREQMVELAAAKGAEFDRLFLKLMIQHHEGALAMVGTLFGSRGAGQEPEMYRFASDVDTDQRMEIERMSALLRELQPAGTHE